MIKVGIAGITGYGGIELFRLIQQHPEAELTALTSQNYNGQKVSSLYPHISQFETTCEALSSDEMAERCDCLITAVPHGGVSFSYVESAKKYNKKIVDLSADFRLNDRAVFEEWYKCEHELPELLKEAVYGLPELHKERIKGSWLTANPGCYTTASILSNAPLLKNDLIEKDSIIIDAKSGVSGAGRKPKPNLHFTEVDEGISAYAVAGHRHTPEIEQELSLISGNDITLTFTPHLVPMIRGILAVSYSKLKKDIKTEELYELYREFYKGQPFVRIAEDYLPCTKFVAGSNYIDIALKVDERTGRVIVIAAIDNLIKGASGQAVQNMNLMFGLDERTGLDYISVYP